MFSDAAFKPLVEVSLPIANGTTNRTAKANELQAGVAPRSPRLKRPRLKPEILRGFVLRHQIVGRGLAHAAHRFVATCTAFAASISGTKGRISAVLESSIRVR